MDGRTRVRVHIVCVTGRMLHSIARRRMGFEPLMPEQSSVQRLLVTCQVEYLPGHGVRMETYTAARGFHQGARATATVGGKQRPILKSE